MKYIYTLLIILFCMPARAQQYKKFLNKSAWIIEVFDQGGQGPDAWYYWSKDTTVNGKKYGIIKNNEFGTFMAREDTVAKKVYINRGAGDFVLYDFSLQIGNSVNVTVMLDPSHKLYCSVIDIDTVLMQDGPHRRLILSEQRQFGANIAMVEGTGALSHPFMVYNILSDPSYRLKCKFDAARNIYHGDTACRENPYYHNTSVADLNPASSVISYPNPSSGKISFISTGDFTLSVFDVTGRELMHCQDPKEILLPSGLFILVYSWNGMQKTEKVLVN